MDINTIAKNPVSGGKDNYRRVVIGVKRKWRVIYTKSRQEKKVAATLTSMGIKNYLPTVTVLKQWSDRKKKVQEVLFKSYVFVNLSDREYYNVLKIPGVVKYVSFGGRSVQVSDKQMDTIIKTVENKLEFDVSSKYFAKGTLIKIQYGPFRGQSGEVVSFAGKKKLLIRINEIGYSLLVQLSPGCVHQVAIK